MCDDRATKRYGVHGKLLVKRLRVQIEFVTIEEQLPFEYYLFIETKSEEMSINCENIDSFVLDEKSGRLTLVYFMPKVDILGRRIGEEMEAKKD